MLEVDGLHFRYQGTPLLRGINITVVAGESVFLSGPSGCGKTTLLRCIAGLETPDQGAVRLDDQDMRGIPAHRRRIGMMFQEPALFPHLDVTGNVAFGLRYRPDNTDAAEETARFIELVGLGDKGGSAIHELSGGQRQRVALARTLAAAPRAVLLDEPLSALDRDLRDDLGDRIKALLAEAGVPALWVTHDKQEAERLGDKALTLLDGRITTTAA